MSEHSSEIMDDYEKNLKTRIDNTSKTKRMLSRKHQLEMKVLEDFSDNYRKTLKLCIVPNSISSKEQYEKLFEAHNQNMKETKAMLLRKRQFEMKILDDQLDNYRKILQESIVPNVLSSMDELDLMDIEIQNQESSSSSIYDDDNSNKDPSSTSNLEDNNSNKDSSSNSNFVDNQIEDSNGNSSSIQANDKTPTIDDDHDASINRSLGFNLNENTFEIANEEFFCENINESSEDENVEAPRVKREIQRDSNGKAKQKCSYCRKLFGKNFIEKHEIICFVKIKKIHKSLYCCAFEECNYETPTTANAQNYIKRHIQFKHGILNNQDQQKYILKKNNPDY